MSPPSATRRHELLAASQAWERDQASYKPLLNATDLVFNDAGDSSRASCNAAEELPQPLEYDAEEGAARGTAPNSLIQSRQQQPWKELEGDYDSDDSLLAYNHQEETTANKVGVGRVNKASPMRWWALTLFVLLCSVQNLCWIAFSTILDNSKLHYNITTTETNRLVEAATIVFIPGVFLFSPLSDRYGLKVVVIASCACVAAGGVCRWLGNTYAWLYIGQALNGMAGPVIMNAPPQLAALWFPPHQRATATAVGWGASCIGISIGYVVGPTLAPTPDRIPDLMRVLGIMTLSLFVLSLTFPTAPAVAPSASASVDKLGFFKGLSQVMRNRSFLLLMASWSISGAVFQAWATFLDMFLDTRYTDGAIGQLGVSANLLSMAGSFLIPPVVQVLGLQRRWKWVIIVLLFVAAAGVAGFTYLLYDVYGPPPSTNHTNQTNRSQMYSIYSAYPTDGNAAVPPYSLQYAQYMHAHSYYPNDVFGPVGGGVTPDTPTLLPAANSTTNGLLQIGLVYGVASFAFGGVSPIALELASEIVFPVSEESAAAYMTLMYQVLNIFCMEIGNVMLHLDFNILTAALFGVCTLLVIPVVSKNARQNLDE